MEDSFLVYDLWEKLLKKTVEAFCVVFLIISLNYIRADERRVIIFILDQINLTDLTDSKEPNLNWLIQHSGLGLLTTRTAEKRRTTAGIYATIGAGFYARAGEESQIAANAKEFYENSRADEVFYRRTGLKAPSGAVLNLGIVELINCNREGAAGAQPGALGSDLNQAGLRTCVLGNADTVLELKRPATLIAMNEWGMVDYGNVSKALLAPAPDCPFGAKTDIPKTISQFDKFYHKSRFILIDFGDTSRAENYRKVTTKERTDWNKREAIKRFDNLLGEILKRIDLKSTLLMVLIPSAPPFEFTGRIPLGTLIMTGGKASHQGLLYSASTRRLGLVTNIDIAPTVLDFLKVKPLHPFQGHPIFSQPVKGDAIEILEANEAQGTLLYRIRFGIIRGFVVCYISLLILAAFIILWPKKSKKAVEPLRLLILVSIALPLTSLIIPLFQPFDFGSYVLLSSLFSSFLALLFLPFKERSIQPLFYISASIIFLILLDCLLGSKLHRTSLFGYDDVYAARFYGIGNEYMGILIGATLWAGASSLDMFPSCSRCLKFILPLIFLAVAFSLGYPRLGANVGGFLAALLAFGFAGLKIFDLKIRLREGLYIFAFVLLCIALLALVDYFAPEGKRSHLGQLIQTIQMGESGEAWRMVSRKILMNWQLIKTNIWRSFILAFIGVLALFIYKIRGVISRALAPYPNLKKGLAAAIVGEIAVLLLNDSGIVSMGTMLIIVGMGTIYLVLMQAYHESQP